MIQLAFSLEIFAFNILKHIPNSLLFFASEQRYLSTSSNHSL